EDPELARHSHVIAIRADAVRDHPFADLPVFERFDHRALARHARDPAIGHDGHQGSWIQVSGLREQGSGERTYAHAPSTAGRNLSLCTLRPQTSLLSPVRESGDASARNHARLRHRSRPDNFPMLDLVKV